MRRLYALGYTLVALSAAAGLVVLDAVGVFIYASYIPAVLIVASVILGGIFIAGRSSPRSRGDVMAFGIATLVLLTVALVCPALATSPRKSFLLDARAVKSGMSLNEAQRRMAAYSSVKRYPNTVTFLFKSNADTVDTVIVHLTSDGSRVAAVEYSPD